VTPMSLIVRGLAVARLTQLVVEDEITQPLRDAVEHQAQKSSAWDQVDTAINCGACTSVWAGGAVLTAERGGPVGRFLVAVLALSQAALTLRSVIERIDR
jgi:Protein of unknown function (DUF1360)